MRSEVARADRARSRSIVGSFVTSDIGVAPILAAGRKSSISRHRYTEPSLGLACRDPPQDVCRKKPPCAASIATFPHELCPKCRRYGSL